MPRRTSALTATALAVGLTAALTVAAGAPAQAASGTGAVKITCATDGESGDNHARLHFDFDFVDLPTTGTGVHSILPAPGTDTGTWEGVVDTFTFQPDPGGGEGISYDHWWWVVELAAGHGYEPAVGDTFHWQLTLPGDTPSLTGTTVLTQSPSICEDSPPTPPTPPGTPATPPGTSLGTLAPAPRPKIVGKAKVGKKLHAQPRKWGPGAVTISYQWYLGKWPEPGATKKKLKLKAAWAGVKAMVRVTATKPGYATVVRYSKPSKKIHKPKGPIATQPD